MLAVFVFVLLAAVGLEAEGDCEEEVLVQVPDPVALYPLDGAHGTKEIIDRVGEGTASGVSTAPGPDGKPDGSYEFLGTVNSYIEFPNGGGIDTSNSMTMLCWLFPGGQDGPLFNYRTSGSWGVHLWVVAGQLFVRFTRRHYAFTNALLNTYLKPEDGWKFVGASYDQANGDAKLWVDGQVVQTLNIGANLHLATQDSVRMGVKIGDGRYFKGRIAQMQIYNVALTQEQIQTIKERTPVDACQAPLGMESGAISDAQISASSQWDSNHAAIQGRLNFKAGNGKQGGWSSGHNNQIQWLQADLGSSKEVTYLATQGRNAVSQWVTSYKLEYSNDGSSFMYYQEQGADKIFTANSDQDTIVYNVLSAPITARYIRIHPWTYHNHISMRMEIYGC